MSDRIPPKDVVPASGPFSPIIVPTREQKDAYLERVALGRSLHGAASDVGLPYMSFVRERKADKSFDDDVNIAVLARAGALLEIALEQCTVGVDEVLTHQGHISYEYPAGYELDEMGMVKPGTVRKPVTVKKLVTSNPMLLALLKALHPEQFKERVEVTTHAAPKTIEEEQQRTLEAVKRDLVALLKVQQPADPDEDLL